MRGRRQFVGMRVWVALGVTALLVASSCGSREPRGLRAASGEQAVAGDQQVGTGESGAASQGDQAASSDGGAPGAGGTGSGGTSSGGTSTGGATAGAGQKTQGAQSASAGGDCPGPRAGDPIAIGGSFPLSGPVGFLGKQELAAMDSFARMWNARGGICGRKFRVVPYDDGMDSSRQLANMRKLNEQDKVLLAGTILTVGIGDYVTRNKVPILALGGAMEPFSPKQPTVFASIGSAVHFTGAFIEGYKRLGVVKPGMRIGLLYDTEIFNLGPVANDLAAQWERAGMHVVSLDAFNLSNGDCTSLLLKVRQANIDFWDFQGFGWTLCVAAAQRQGYRPPAGWGGWTTSAAGIPELAGPYADGVWMGGTDQHSSEYEAAMRRYHPEQMGNAADVNAPPSIGIWALLKVLELAIKKHGGAITRDQVISYFQGVTALEIKQGQSSPVSFTPTCKTGTTPAPNTGFRVGQWKYNAGTKRFDASLQGAEIADNPYANRCEASKLAGEKY